jgi:DNA modification methylase
MTWQIHNADCLAHMRTMADASVDCVVTSPPYDSVRTYGAAWSLDYKAMGDELLRVCSDGAVCAVVIADGTKDFAKSLTTFRWAVDWVDRAGWRLFECCIYHRHGRPGAWWNKRFRVDHEYILLFLKGDRPAYFTKDHLAIPAKSAGTVVGGSSTRTSDGGLIPMRKFISSDTKCRGSVWHYATSSTEGNRLKLQHPATFPDKLASDLVKCFAAPGATVFDPFTGSGTTGVACLETGRAFVGTEIDPGYADIARRRCREAEESVALLATGGAA